jgi:predicted kinase
MVNGLPGVGKTTLATELAATIAATLLSKDAIKEAFAKSPEVVARSGDSLGVAASEHLWSCAASRGGRVIVESWWYRPRDIQHAIAGLRRSGAVRAIEIWCTAPVDVIRERYQRRRRQALHNDLQRFATDWETWAATAEPLAVVPVVPISTIEAVDVAELAHLANAVLQTSALIPIRATAAQHRSP